MTAKNCLPLLLGSALIVLSSCTMQTRKSTSAPETSRSKTASLGVVDNSTLNGKLIMGYQAWFGAKGDGSSAGWNHWSRSRDFVRPDSLTVDMWPDVSEYDADELYDTGMKLRNGKPALLYSNQNRKTVMRHFKWMQDYGIDGVMNGRFVGGLIPPRSSEALEEIPLKNIRASAEAYGRLFMIAYDVSGTPANQLNDAIVNDWHRLVDELKLTESPSYVRHRGKPVIMVWGLGNGNPPMPASQAEDLLNRLKNGPAKYQVTVMGGVIRDWRTGSTPEWQAFYRKFDIISPWSVGGFPNIEGAEAYARDVVVPDVEEARRVGADYMPVVWPGFSWANLQQRPGDLNGIPRLGGRHWWKQAHRYIEAGSTMLLGAMFDEVDEGTAIMKTVATSLDGPEGCHLLYLDADGEQLPSDWYLRVARETSRMLKGEIPLTSELPLKLPSGAMTGGTILGIEKALSPAQRLVAMGGRTHLENQVDGNLVLYRDGVPLWASQTSGNIPGRAIMQSDGNFVLYNGNNVPIWASQTGGNPGAELHLQNDGNLVIYRDDGVPIWSTNTRVR